MTKRPHRPVPGKSASEREARLKEDSEMPDHGTFDRHDQHWPRRERFVYAGREVSYDELPADTEAEAAGLDPVQWLGGEFDFDWWLSDSPLTGHVERVDDDEAGWMTGAPWMTGSRDDRS